jgi:hypothetical protein
VPKNEIPKEIPINKNYDKTNDFKKDKMNPTNISTINNNLISKQKPISSRPSNSNNQLNNSSSNLISRLRPEQIEKLRQREQLSAGNNRPKSSSSSITSNNNYNKPNDDRSVKNMSAWDRAVADIKKKTTSKFLVYTIE